MATSPARGHLGSRALASLLLATACERGDVAPPPSPPEYPGVANQSGSRPGRWTRRWTEPPAGLSREQLESWHELAALGYTSGSRTPAAAGVTRFDPARSAPGLNLYTSGHAPEARLIDATGRTLHTWQADFFDLWPDFMPRDHPGTQFWRRVRLLPDGGLLAIFEGLGLVRLDRESRVVWAELNGAHHDLVTLPDGSIWTLVRDLRMRPDLGHSLPVLEDSLIRLNARGAEELRISLLEAFRASQFVPLVAERLAAGGDLFHTNSLRLLDGSLESTHPAFRAGNLLVALNEPGVLAVVEPSSRRVVWAWRGDFPRGVHDPEPLAGGRLLVFDNGTTQRGSRVLEIDLAARVPRWSFGEAPGPRLLSLTCGAVQRLGNGNTLITESDAGRALEVTAAGEIVWEFHNPATAGSAGEYVATLFELERLPPMAPPWLMAPPQRKASGPAAAIRP